MTGTDNASSYKLTTIAEPIPIETENKASNEKDHNSPISRANRRHTQAHSKRILQHEQGMSQSPSSAQASKGPKRQYRNLRPVKAGRFGNIFKSDYGGLLPITRIPPLEMQRRRLANVHDTSAFDNFIYGQAGSSQPPLGVAVSKRSELRNRKNVFYGHIDLRIHRTHPHSDEWYKQKEAEIEARGGRKTNFGKAAQRMRQQGLKEDFDEWEENLPERVRNDGARLTAMRTHHRRAFGGRLCRPSRALAVARRRPWSRGN